MRNTRNSLRFQTWCFFALSIPGAFGFGESQKFLVVSSPATGHVAYLKLPSDGSPATATGQAMKTLISSELVFPQGIAIDDHRGRLFVADPNKTGLVMYSISSNGDTLSVGSPKIVASGVQTRAVAVDALGNAVFSDEPTNRLMRVSAQMINEGKTTPEVLYDGASVSSVKSPGGVASDNYFVYWLNKAGSAQAGTLNRGLQYGTAQSLLNASKGIQMLANNALKCYGVCLAAGHIFYTDEAPRGCVHDGAGTVYVADKSQNAVFYFASNMQMLEPNRPLVKAAELQGAFGLAMFDAGYRSPGLLR